MQEYTGPREQEYTSLRFEQLLERTVQEMTCLDCGVSVRIVIREYLDKLLEDQGQPARVCTSVRTACFCFDEYDIYREANKRGTVVFDENRSRFYRPARPSIVVESTRPGDPKSIKL